MTTTGIIILDYHRSLASGPVLVGEIMAQIVAKMRPHFVTISGASR